MKQYYIVSVKHTSKGDTALTFWRANGGGYTWHRDAAGVYSEEEIKKICSSLDIPVEKELADKYWMNALDFKDEYVSIPNTKMVCALLCIPQAQMKPKKLAGCRMAFLNTPIEELQKEKK